jgi:hypothetical protein
MNQFTNKEDVIIGGSGPTRAHGRPGIDELFYQNID